MKLRKILSCVMVAVMLTGMIIVPSAEETEWKNPFTDVSKNDWFYENVAYANINGLFAGTTPTTFDPQSYMRRCDFCLVLARLDGADLTQYSYNGQFTDVSANDYFATSVEWAYQKGIVNGMSANIFAPANCISRQDMCVMLNRYFSLNEIEQTNMNLTFTDQAAIQSYAAAAVKSCVNFQIINGTKENGGQYFHPADSATRAQTAAILQRFCEQFGLPHLACINYNTDMATFDTAYLQAMVDDLAALLSACTNKGITCPYETAYVTDLQRQVNLFNAAKERGTTKVRTGAIEGFNKVYKYTQEALISYYYDLAEPFEVPNFDTSTLAVDGNNLVATYDNGKTEPVYAIGQGHWINNLEDDLEDLEKLSSTIVQIDIATANGVLTVKGKGDHTNPILTENDPFDINVNYINNTLIPFLEKCRDYNISVCPLFSAQNNPKNMLNPSPYTDEMIPVEGNMAGMSYSTNNDYARRYYEVMIKVVVEAIQKAGLEDSVFTYCISNEPAYNANRHIMEDTQYWIQYLKDTFGTVQALNTAVGGSYPSFDSIAMPTDKKEGGIYYVYCQFNEKEFSDYHAYLANIVSSLSTKPCNSKVTAFMRDIVISGVNQEQFASWSGIVGNDAYSFLSDEGNGRYGKAMWYSYLSLLGKPIYNSEDHVYQESAYTGDYDSDAVAGHIYMEMWEGAVNGRSASSAWSWRPDLGKDDEYGYSGNISDKAYALAEQSRAALDLKRLHSEVNALNDATPEYYILFSESSMANDPHIYWDSEAYAALEFAYQTALGSGMKVGVVPESMIDTLPDNAVLMVPNTQYVSDNTLNKIKAFADKGEGTLLMLNYTKELDAEGSNCLQFNQFGVARNTQLVQSIYDKAQVYAYKKDNGSVWNFISWMRRIVNPKLELRNGSFSVTNVSYYTIEYNGRTLLQIGNYEETKTQKNIKIYYNNTQITGFTDLITGQTYTSADSLTLAPSDCYLLDIGPAK